MNKSFLISDEILNAFIDNELDLEEHNQIVQIAQYDTSLSERINNAQNLKLLVRAAKIPISIKEAPINSEYPQLIQNQFTKPYYLIASIILIVCATLFSSTGENYNRKSYDSTYNNKDLLQIATQFKKDLKIVLDIKSSNSEQVNDLFNFIEYVSQTAKHNDMQIEIVLSSSGIKILQEGVSAHAKTIQEIGKNNKNVTFIACQKSLQKLQRSSNKPIKIIKEAMLVSSGPIWSKNRKQQGWSSLTI